MQKDWQIFEANWQTLKMGFRESGHPFLILEVLVIQ
jgi:hypothetical protein